MAMRCGVLLAGLSLLGVTLIPSRAFAENYGISGFERALSVVGGKARWSNDPKGHSDWSIRKTAKGYTIQVRGSKWGGGI
jgi:hypothetical protein